MHHPPNGRIAPLVAALLISLLSVAPRLISQTANISPAEQDPDIPDFARQTVNKEEFMILRSEAIGIRRGVEKDKPFDPTKRIDAIRQMEEQQARIAARTNSSQRDALMAIWTEIGPNPIPNGQVGTGPQLAVSGRTTAIAVHPTNPNIVYVGAAQGGLYRSTDGGTNWTPLLDNALSLAVGAVAIAPSSPDVVYVGTGEPNFSADSYFGVGVYRIDNASTASPTITGPLNDDATNADIFTGRAIGEILVHPTDPATIFVATTSGIGGIGPATPSVLPSRGIYRSTDATSADPTFTKLTGLEAGGNFSIRDMILDPLNPNLLVCNLIANGGGIYVSTDALAASPTFTRRVTFSSTSTSELTAEFAIQHTGGPNPTIYAATGNLGGRVLINTDGGTTWTQQIDNNFCTAQCFYDIAIDVNPTDATRVYLGGSPNLVFGISTNSGVSFTPSESGLHVDSHVITVAPSSPATIYFGSDGGIYKSTDSGTSWTSLNNTTFRATQFMSLAVHPTDPNFTIGGTQDNGTNFYQPAGTWTRADFGDGGYAAIDQNAADVTNVRMYHTYFNQTNAMGYSRVTSVASATEGNWTLFGCGFGGTPNGMTCTATAILFYAPMETGPGNPNTLYFGSDVLYRSSDGGTTVTKVSQDPIASSVAISAIGISPQNDNVRIVGQNNGGIFGTSTGANPLLNLDALGAVPNNFIARAVVDPNSTTTAYVTLSAFGVTNVWKTTTLSAVNPTWTAVAGSGGTALPLVPVNAFVVDPASSNNLFAGSDIGVYVSTDAGTSWLPFGAGLPRVAVFDMAIHPVTRTLRIATHGRGLWENNGSPLPVQIASFTATMYNQHDVLLSWTTLSELNCYGFDCQRALDRRGPYGTIDGSFVPGHGTTNEPHDYSYIDTTAQPGIWFYRLKQIDLDGSVHYTEAVEINTTITSVLAQTSPTEFGLGQNYPNPFNPTTTISFSVAFSSEMMLEVFDVLGRSMGIIQQGRIAAGTHSVDFDASHLASGVYFYRMTAGPFTEAKKLVVSK